MIDELKLLKGDDFIIDDKIEIHHPKLSEVVAIGEKEYFSMVSSLCSTPSDYKSILYDNFGVDYTEVSEFDFFLMMWSSLNDETMKLLLPNIVRDRFVLVQHSEDQRIGLYDSISDIFIDDQVYNDVVDYIRKFHGLTKRVDNPGNENTKKYLIKKARKELKNPHPYRSTLAPLVSSMVNCGDFKYDHKTVWDLNIYQLMDSVKRIQKMKNIEHIMHGIYAGTIDQKNISQDTLDWLGAIK